MQDQSSGEMCPEQAYLTPAEKSTLECLKTAYLASGRIPCRKTIARACGQTHTGNIESLLRSLSVKRYINYFGSDNPLTIFKPRMTLQPAPRSRIMLGFDLASGPDVLAHAIFDARNRTFLEVRRYDTPQIAGQHGR